MAISNTTMTVSGARREDREEYERRILGLAAESMKGAPSGAKGPSPASTKAARSTPVTAAAGIDENDPAIQELRRMQAEARARGWRPSWEAGPSTVIPAGDTTREQLVAACAQEFASSAAIREEFGSVGCLAAWRAAEASGRTRIRRGPQADQFSIDQARQEFAASPALQSAFESERLYVAHRLGEWQRGR